MRKRILSMFLVTAMAVAMLAGCGNETKKEETKQEETKKTSGDASAEVKSQETEKKEEPVTVKWLIWEEVKQEDVDFILEDLNKKLVEKINVKLDMEVIPYAEYDERVRLASSAGEEFDIVYTSNWKNNFTQNMDRGSLLQLDDLIDQYGQDIVANVQPELWDVTKVGGDIYAIPNQQIAARQIGLFIQKDLADKYNWTKTHIDHWSELVPFLEAVRDNEEGITPIHIAQNVNPRKYESLKDIVYIDIKDDPSDGIEVQWKIFGEEDSDWKVKYELYTEGFIHQEYPHGFDMNSLKKVGKIAVQIGTASPYGEVAFSSANEEEYILCTLGQPFFGYDAGQDTMLGINVNSKHPDAAVKLINALWADEEIFNELMFGIEGVHYDKVGEQRVEVKESSEWLMYVNAWAYGNQFARWKVPGEEDDVWELTSELNRSSECSPIRGFVPDYTNLSAEIAQIRAVQGEYSGICYTEGWEAKLEEYYAKLEKAGIDVIVKEIQRQIDEWLAANK